MPIYEYRCESCGKIVEVLTGVASADPAPQLCTCGQGSSFVRVYSTFAAHAEAPHETHIAPCGREGCCGGACELEE